MAGSGSALASSASIPLSVSCSVFGASSSRWSDNNSTTSSGSASEYVDTDVSTSMETRVKTDSTSRWRR